MESTPSKLKQIVPAVIVTVSLALGLAACASSDKNPDGYDPNTDSYPALSIDSSYTDLL